MTHARLDRNHLTGPGHGADAGGVQGLVRAYRSARLVALRLRLPSRFARQSLDALLAGLTARAPRASRPQLSELGRDLRLGERVAALIPGVADTCLFRALARYALLSRSGVAVSFVMGVDASGGDGDGHAWVEVGGQPFAEPSDTSRFAVTYRYPPTEDDVRLSRP